MPAITTIFMLSVARALMPPFLRSVTCLNISLACGFGPCSSCFPAVLRLPTVGQAYRRPATTSRQFSPTFGPAHFLSSLWFEYKDHDSPYLLLPRLLSFSMCYRRLSYIFRRPSCHRPSGPWWQRAVGCGTTLHHIGCTYVFNCFR